MTTRRRVHYVLVCEDQQHETFARRFLKETRLVTDPYQLRVERSPSGRGAADRFVQEVYVEELDAGRRSHVATTLLLLADGDAVGIDGRLRRLDAACKRRGVAARSPADSVAVFIPTWNIETWLAYLDDQTVDESRKNYPRLARPGDCRRHVGVLVEMCQRGTLRSPAPESLRAACREYDARLRPT